MTNTTTLPTVIFNGIARKALHTAFNLGGLHREISEALAWITTDVLVAIACEAYDTIKRPMYRHGSKPVIVRPAWLEGRAILDESRVRDTAISCLCSWAHDQRAQSFSHAWARKQNEERAARAYVVA